MYLEAKETARLYELLSEKLGNDTTEAMFKYIDNKTERAVEANIKSLATKDDIVRLEKSIAALQLSTKEDIAALQLSTKEDIAALQLSTKQDIAALHLSTKEDIAALQLSTKNDISAFEKSNLEFRLSVKEEFVALIELITAFKLSFKDEMTAIRLEAKEANEALKQELNARIADTIKWSFVFWVGQFATLFGLVYLLMKK